MRKILGGVAALTAATMLALLTDGSAEPHPAVIPLLAVVFAGACIGWLLIRPRKKDVEMDNSRDDISGAVTSGDNSPASSAAHSGRGDINIDQSTHNHSSSTSEVITYKGERLIDKSARDLIGYYESHTSIQADRLVEVFLGKPVQVVGTVSNVGMSLSKEFVRVALSDPDNNYMFASFASAWADRLTELNKGDNVKIVGRLESVDSISVGLDECDSIELVK